MENKRLIDEPRARGAMGYLQKTISLDDTIGFFSFNKAVGFIDSDRCDKGYAGPSSFHQNIDGICNCGNIDDDNSTVEVCQFGVATINSIKFAQPIYLAPPIGYLCYQEFIDPSVEELFCRQHWNANARTLQELLKLMCEWSDCYTLLDSNLEIAKTAYELLVDLNMPNALESWVREEVPDQAVARFLLGDSSARDRAIGIPDMSDDMSCFLREKLDPVMAFGGGNIRNTIQP